MYPLSYVTIVWSVTAAAAGLLGLMHFWRWAIDRQAHVDLTFSIVAFAFVGVAIVELQSMHARTPADWSAWIKLIHLPLAIMLIGTIMFVRQYLGTASAWFAACLIGLRVLILAINALSDPNINFERVVAIDRVPFLGEQITVVGEAVTGRWQVLGTLATALLLVFVLDAAARLWRRGQDADRRRAAVIGGGMFVSVCLASIYTQLVIWRLVNLPLLITPSFMVMLLAMAYQLSRETLRAPRLARELEESHRRLERAAEAADAGLWEWDSGTAKVWATQRAREIFGLTESVAGQFQSWIERIHPDDASRVQSELESALGDGRELNTEYRVCPPGCGDRWVAQSGRAESTAGGPRSHLRGVVRDVSEQRRALEETQELRQELAHAGRVSVLGQLASSLAHELSQPLGAILRNTEAADVLLRSPAPDHEELKAIVADIQRDDRRAGEVIDRLRSLLKYRQLDFQPIAVEGVVNDVVALLRADAATRHVTLTSTVQPALPAVAGDRVHLSQVLINLAINGMDAVMGMTSSRRRVVLEANRGAGDTVELTVRDSGTGISPDALARIFEPFYTTKASGMGMGLSVSRTIVDAHGGTLGVENASGGGAIFRVSLPAAQGGAA